MVDQFLGASEAVTPWDQLPVHLLELILIEKVDNHDEKTLYGIVGTCKHWRALCMPHFFSQLWNPFKRNSTNTAKDMLVHPSQLFQRAPEDCAKLSCFITRKVPKANGGTLSSNSGTAYAMWLGSHPSAQNPKFLLSAQQMTVDPVINISLQRPHGDTANSRKASAACLGRICDVSVQDPDICAKLHHNLIHTEYVLQPCAQPWVMRALKGNLLSDPATLHDSGNPYKITPGCTASTASKAEGPALPLSLMTARYEFSWGRLLSLSPRRLDVELWPTSTSAADRQTATTSVPSSSPKATTDVPQVMGLGGDDSEKREILTKFQNRLPRWNPELGCWCLNFKNRVKLPSVKNFQLCESGDESRDQAELHNPDSAALLFGKVSEDVYVLDFDPRKMSCVQAFALALTSFERKYTI
ncbi:hypothetical protein CEUSTIGMA_g8391.t1 [Chlamydomonas eustigma]|uniref:Tubby C-terminal domain-containing protein n=1 Tax=Chlamydomonas eustigma TaxID=1157962 RepID=A0A250XD23_9CHLO|nr:hypothetical protein CEUSTIGMA_g8391.t1 [Chlamydomonas eustigma]|eukprot:GAX80956.1 hypothetical protein CEUSTIGMA_g8391.t1 [Chlamydomonas eustigma]